MAKDSEGGALPADRDEPVAMIVGASRGIGFAIAEALVGRGWRVIGTVRAGGVGKLQALAETAGGQVEIETLDIDDAGQIAALASRLSGRTLDMLFVNAGITGREPDAPIGSIPTEEFARVMATNALGPLRVVEALQHLVPASGLIGAMSSGQGSIADNETGRRELYRASKAALNMLMRSFAAREANRQRAIAVIAPGWIRTELGGSDAPYSLEETVPAIVDILLAKRGVPGIRYLDRFGHDVAW